MLNYFSAALADNNSQNIQNHVEDVVLLRAEILEVWTAEARHYVTAGLRWSARDYNLSLYEEARRARLSRRRQRRTRTNGSAKPGPSCESKKGSGGSQRSNNKRGRAAWSSSCSRNAHDQNVLVRRAHSRMTSPPLKGWTSAAGGREETARCPSCSQNSEGMEPDDLLCSRNARPVSKIGRIYRIILIQLKFLRNPESLSGCT